MPRDQKTILRSALTDARNAIDVSLERLSDLSEETALADLIESARTMLDFASQIEDELGDLT